MKGSDVKLYKKGNQNCQGRVWSSTKNINSQSGPRGDILYLGPRKMCILLIRISGLIYVGGPRTDSRPDIIILKCYVSSSCPCPLSSVQASVQTRSVSSLVKKNSEYLVFIEQNIAGLHCHSSVQSGQAQTIVEDPDLLSLNNNEDNS